VQNLFYVLAVSPDRLPSLAVDGLQFLRGFLLMDEFNFALAWQQIEKLLERSSAEDWNTVAEKLERFIDREFEGYKE
jgi:hypothetical protein